MNKLDLKGISIVAQKDSYRFLVSYGDDRASILDLWDHVLSAPMHIDSLLGRGYWVDYTGGIDLEKVLPNIKIETELGGELVHYDDFSGHHQTEGSQCFVFRQNDSDRAILYQEILKGRLRQGWGYSESLSLLQGKESFIQNYLTITKSNEKAACKQWKVLSRMLEIKAGDSIIIPKQPDRHHFLIVKATGGYDFTEPVSGSDDYRHVVSIDQTKIQTVHYDSLETPLVVKRLLKSIAYSAPINIVKKRDFKEAVEELYVSEAEDAMVEAHSLQSKLHVIEEKLYSEWIKTIRNLTPSEFEKLVKEFMQENNFDILKTNSYDRKGGDIDLLCSKEIKIETPFEPKAVTLTYCIQIKKHTGQTNATGVHQLNKMEDSLDLDEPKLVQKILISLADNFTKECIDLASESDVLLLNGMEFAKLYFK